MSSLSAWGDGEPGRKRLESPAETWGAWAKETVVEIKVAHTTAKLEQNRFGENLHPQNVLVFPPELLIQQPIRHLHLKTSETTCSPGGGGALTALGGASRSNFPTTC